MSFCCLYILSWAKVIKSILTLKEFSFKLCYADVLFQSPAVQFVFIPCGAVIIVKTINYHLTILALMNE